jgi:hypothetical protein
VSVLHLRFCNSNNYVGTLHKTKQSDVINENIIPGLYIETPTKTRSSLYPSLQDFEYDQKHSTNLNEHVQNSFPNNVTERGNILPNSIVPNNELKTNFNHINGHKKHPKLHVNTKCRMKESNYRIQEFLRKDEFDEFNNGNLTGIPSPLNEENLAKHNEMFPYIPTVKEFHSVSAEVTCEGFQFKKSWKEFTNAITSCFVCNAEKDDQIEMEPLDWILGDLAPTL